MREWRKPFEGIVPNLVRRYQETESNELRERLQAQLSYEPCPDCGGARLKPESLAVTIGGKNIWQFCTLSIESALAFANGLKLTPAQEKVSAEILKEVRTRLGFLQSVGLEYLTLARESGGLSGGEAQRIRLATQVGSGLVGVLYILDEPSIGLHQRDNTRLLETLEKLRRLGNTVVVVEHDMKTIEKADYLVDLGPGAGRLGGEVVACGTPAEVAKVARSVTGQFLCGARRIALPAERRPGLGKSVRILGAAEHNLKGIDVEIPLGTFCCITGVSGSGKSTLIDDILKNVVYRKLGIKADPPGKHKKVEGLEHVDKMIVIDQSPIGRTPRSNPATYTEAFNFTAKVSVSWCVNNVNSIIFILNRDIFS
jgi:excinuclease ABC subunit A